MIIACTSCPAQYSVPDAKVQGKKVRVTCKHCGAGIIVDATGMRAGGAEASPMSLPEPMPVAPRVLPGFDVPRAPGPDDDATRIMMRPSDYSVHDEPTVIGQIPQEALDAERRFSLRTEPPPRDTEEAAAPPVAIPAALAPTALLHDVPERAADITALASPQAFRNSAASLQTGDAELGQGMPEFRPRRWPWLLGVAVALALLLVAVNRALR